MTIIHHIAPRALSIFLGFMSMLLPLKPINIYATEPSSPPECKEGYEYIESIGKCYKKCNDGWERNPETNRCRKIRIADETPGSSLSPSSPESSGSSSSSNSPTHSSSPESSSSYSSPADTCQEGYEYVVSAGKCYKACRDGQERNPETNRCRKIQVESPSDAASSSSTSASSAGNSSGSSSSASGSSSSSSSSKLSDSSSLPPSTCQEGYEYVASAGKCYKACSDGQERNPETNRCRKIQDDSSNSTSSSTKSNSSNISSSATCKEGYEYVASAGKCYKACTDGQIRNPETNRCKKAESSTSTLKECEEGYERNPETNRCRKIKNNDGADYDVEVPETGGATSFIAIGAIIAIVLAGLAFVGFQYRKEIAMFISKHLKKAKKSS